MGIPLNQRQNKFENENFQLLNDGKVGLKQGRIIFTAVGSLVLEINSTAAITMEKGDLVTGGEIIFKTAPVGATGLNVGTTAATSAFFSTDSSATMTLNAIAALTATGTSSELITTNSANIQYVISGTATAGEAIINIEYKKLNGFY
jgi:hypothetical protein